jgi:hypothetical protein
METAVPYNILELSKMSREDIEKVAKKAGIDTLNKTRQVIIYKILDEQQLKRVTT